ncbi:PEP-CTERM sorting domain-containing protein [Roseofilum capinflatum]|uniref:PEP-CTERM sorting domain-containing protein n=1 Tax=Roseofilum capinflatum BLCC-M114 TaxID=3022440 RepID=A0ABT7B5X9_9CYAN|nr:PEP-CTERM sorting domain-containing protein [Roseofilum capinflatum]MDJ1174034.1 PEP-CTERM sorting domain-containing protein [Roseofilum capinflatum BLCC-M114]
MMNLFNAKQKFSIFMASLVFWVLLPNRSEAALINFDDGVHGEAIDSFYANDGVEFQNAQWVNNHGLSGTSGSFAMTNGLIWTSSNPVVATFAPVVSSISIVGIDIGLNGVRIDAYDSSTGGNLIGFDQVFGSSDGVGEFFTLEVNFPTIKRVEIYQPRNIMPSDGILLEDLQFERVEEVSSPESVPEPSSVLGVLAFGALGVGFLRQRKQG